MVSEANRTGLYVTIPIYFAFLAMATFWAYRRMEQMSHNGVSDKLAAHYLGGRSFGPLLTAGTLFASLFSGYTVVGVPNEAYRLGWFSMRWMPGIMAAAVGCFGTGLRLRKASMLRNHQSPVDFITDRYQSQLLRYTIVLLQLIPTLIYLAAQVVAIKGTFNSIFELDPDATYPVIIIMGVILVFEWLGGLNSVALTDAFQAIVMVLSFLILPVVIVVNFGGWSQLDPETYPRPEFYQTPSKEAQWGFWQFAVAFFGFFTLPHILQRVYAARDLKSLRAGWTVMTIGSWFTLFVGVFLGTIGVIILADEEGNPTSPANPFTAILEEVMNLGGFAKGAATIVVTASLAAIMSTADSLIIAISQLITVEVVYPLRPNATTTEVTMIGKVVSLVSTILALIVGIYWTDGLSDLGAIQFSLSLQALPAFVLGLFATSKKTDMHPWCLATAAIAGAVSVIALYFGYLKSHSDPMPINAGIFGMIIQIVAIAIAEPSRRLYVGFEVATKEVVVVPTKKDEDLKTLPTDTESAEVQLLYPDRPSWDVPRLLRFGERPLTPQLVTKSMEGIHEPQASPWWFFLLFFVITMITPLTSEFEPPLDTENLTGNVFLYAPAIINGLPWWVLKEIILSIVATLLLLSAMQQIPDVFPIDEEQIEKQGIDVDLVEMTMDEMVKRESYDEANQLIRKRRSSILETMGELGLLDPPEEPEEFAPSPGQRKLADLATRSSRALLSTSFRLGEVAEEEEGEMKKGTIDDEEAA